MLFFHTIFHITPSNPLCVRSLQAEHIQELLTAGAGSLGKMAGEGSFCPAHYRVHTVDGFQVGLGG